MRIKSTLFTLLFLFCLPALATKTGIQNEGVKSLSDITSSNLTTTGNLTSGNACISSIGSTANLYTGLFIYDTTSPTNISSGTTIVGLPGTCSAGQVQMSTNATASATGDTITFGGQMSQLISDTKVYDTTNGQQLSTSISSGALGGAPTMSDLTSNLGLSTSVGSNALTVSLVTASGATPSGSGLVKVGFRNSTAATGQYSIVSVSSSNSITIPSGTTIGTTNGNIAYIYVYALNNAGALELALSLNGLYDTGSVQSTSAISGGATASTLYSTTSRSNVPIRLIGRIAVTETTAGTWTSNASEVSVRPFMPATNLFGYVIWPEAASCVWSNTGSSWASFSANANCTLPSGGNIFGFASAPATKVPAVSAAFLPKGNYEIRVLGDIVKDNAANSNSWFRITDGTNNSNPITCSVPSGGATHCGTMSGFFSYTSDQTSITFQIQTTADSNQTNSIYNSTGSGGPSGVNNLQLSIIRL